MVDFGLAQLLADADAATTVIPEVLEPIVKRVPRAIWERDPGLDVLVCDLDMPGASGLEVLESLRALDRPPLVVVVSGYLDARIEAQLRTMSYVQEVLRKPFDLLGFAGIVRRLLGVARAARGVGETEDEASSYYCGARARDTERALRFPAPFPPRIARSRCVRPRPKPSRYRPFPRVSFGGAHARAARCGAALGLPCRASLSRDTRPQVVVWRHRRGQLPAHARRHAADAAD